LRSYVEEKVAAPVFKAKNAAVGIRHTDYATPLYPQKLALTSPTSGGHLVGIVRSRTTATEILFLFLRILIMPKRTQRILMSDIFGGFSESLQTNPRTAARIVHGRVLPYYSQFINHPEVAVVNCSEVGMPAVLVYSRYNIGPRTLP
jgi:hypothetical protein